VLANSPSGILAFLPMARLASRKWRRFPAGLTSAWDRALTQNQCSICHAQPAVGGTGSATNPQFLFTSNGVAPGNTMPSFITANGPTREARFPFYFNSKRLGNTSNPNGEWRLYLPLRAARMPALAPAARRCRSPASLLPSLRTILSSGFPLRVFGAGLIENLDDSTLLSNQAKESQQRLWHFRHFQSQRQRRHHQPLRLEGADKSLHIFAGEAYNVEMGISNLLFPQIVRYPGKTALTVPIRGWSRPA